MARLIVVGAAAAVGLLAGLMLTARAPRLSRLAAALSRLAAALLACVCTLPPRAAGLLRALTARLASALIALVAILILRALGNVVVAGNFAVGHAVLL
jgi:hypothetical protein